MVYLDLTSQQAMYLARVLDCRLKELNFEIIHTDHQVYLRTLTEERDKVQEIKDRLDAISAKIDESESSFEANVAA